MALERRTIIDQIEIKRDATMNVRLAKQVVDGEEVVTSEYHRIAVEPGADLESRLPIVNAHLAEMHAASVDEAEWERVRRIVGLEHTPKTVAAYRAKASAQQQGSGQEIAKDWVVRRG